MTRSLKRPPTLPPPSLQERADAARAARALRAAIADPSTMGAPSSFHIDYGRPRRGEWVTSWANVPGFLRANGTYSHACLPGWQYTKDEITREMIPDLEALAERGVRPSEATAPSDQGRLFA